MIWAKANINNLFAFNTFSWGTEILFSYWPQKLPLTNRRKTTKINCLEAWAIMTNSQLPVLRVVFNSSHTALWLPDLVCLEINSSNRWLMQSQFGRHHIHGLGKLVQSPLTAEEWQIQLGELYQHSSHSKAAATLQKVAAVTAPYIAARTHWTVQQSGHVSSLKSLPQSLPGQGTMVTVYYHMSPDACIMQYENLWQNRDSYTKNVLEDVCSNSTA